MLFSSSRDEPSMNSVCIFATFWEIYLRNHAVALMVSDHEFKRSRDEAPECVVKNAIGRHPMLAPSTGNQTNMNQVSVCEVLWKQCLQNQAVAMTLIDHELYKLRAEAADCTEKCNRQHVVWTKWTQLEPSISFCNTLRTVLAKPCRCIDIDW